MSGTGLNIIILTQTNFERFWLWYILETESQENTSPITPKNYFFEVSGYPVLLLKVTCPIANAFLYKYQFKHDDNYFLFLLEIKLLQFYLIHPLETLWPMKIYGN